jgi:hypothetical protein
MAKFHDLTGKRYGKLVVLSLYSHGSRKENKDCKWLCRCDCGNEIIAGVRNLNSGNTKSCGCLRYENKGAYKPNPNRVFNSWRAMKQRCKNKSNNRYYIYGGRGIKICEEWDKSFNAFKEWAFANGYSENLTIDRIDPNGDYCPENCRWIPPEQQSATRRCVHHEQ